MASQLEALSEFGFARNQVRPVSTRLMIRTGEDKTSLTDDYQWREYRDVDVDHYTGRPSSRGEWFKF